MNVYDQAAADLCDGHGQQRECGIQHDRSCFYNFCYHHSPSFSSYRTNEFTLNGARHRYVSIFIIVFFKSHVKEMSFLQKIKSRSSYLKWSVMDLLTVLRVALQSCVSTEGMLMLHHCQGIYVDRMLLLTDWIKWSRCIGNVILLILVGRGKGL